MRYVYYYPMTHILDSASWNHIINECLRTRLGKEKAAQLIGDLKDTIDSDMEIFDSLWKVFTNHLKKLEKFDRVYLEGITKKMINPKIENGSGMRDCLAYLMSTGAKFEETENKLFLKLGHKFKSKKKIFDLIDILRESYVGYGIDTTLKDGERGLLLYGGGT